MAAAKVFSVDVALMGSFIRSGWHFDIKGDRQRVCPITIKVSSYLYRHCLWSLYQMDMCDKSKGSIWCVSVTNGAC